MRGAEVLARAAPLVLGLLCACEARAATFIVDWQADGVDAVPGDGLCATSARRCTLRAAVQESNALRGADVILVSAGTYLLSIEGADEDLSATGDLDVRDAVTIRGAGARMTTIDAMEIDRCLDVIRGPSVIEGLTLRGGSRPDCGVGGGMAVRGGASVEVLECHVTDNAGSFGAGLWVGAGSMLTVDRSTISGNETPACGDDSAGGGGVFADQDAVLALLDSTVSGNRSLCGGGILAASGSVTLRGCTVTGNAGHGSCEGSGIWGWEFELANTILAGNVDAGVTECWGTIISLGYNLLGPPPAYGCTVIGDLTGNIVGVPSLLGPLADNGGPVPTHALLAGSPAIDSGNPVAPGSGGAACEGEDERGRLRPQDGDLNGVSTCDIGAVEGVSESGQSSDGIDNDGDTLVDCSDPDCCADVACAFTPETACCDGIDNDCDGDIDLADSDCSSVPGCLELDCANGLDDDGDWLVDCFDEDCCADAACALPEAQCCDRLDNDCDGLMDLADPDCAGAPPCVESDCANGVDDDVDGLRDCADADCVGRPPCNEVDCTNGVDDDGDRLIDCADRDCRGTPTCDDDGDGVPNGSDCAPADPGAIAPPAEIPRLDVARRVSRGQDAVVLTWTDLSGAAGPGLVADVFIGGIMRMWADRGLVGASCRAGDVRGIQVLDVRLLPDPSDGFWYLVRAENACGTGPLGDDSLGVPRDLAGVSCP